MPGEILAIQGTTHLHRDDQRVRSQGGLKQTREGSPVLRDTDIIPSPRSLLLIFIHPPPGNVVDLSPNMRSRFRYTAPGRDLSNGTLLWFITLGAPPCGPRVDPSQSQRPLLSSSSSPYIPSAAKSHHSSLLTVCVMNLEHPRSTMGLCWSSGIGELPSL